MTWQIGSDARQTTQRMAPVAPVLLVLTLAACAGDSALNARLYAVPGKFAWQNCDQLTTVRNAFEKQIEDVMTTMAKAARDPGGDFVNATAHRPTLVKLQAEKRLIEETMAEKRCGAPPPIRSAQAGSRSR